MKTFIITGDCDDACAKLKAELDAADARFQASLTAHFKTESRPPQKPVPEPPAHVAKPQAATAGPSLLSTSRGRDDGSLRGRMRTSLRVTPSR